MKRLCYLFIVISFGFLHSLTGCFEAPKEFVSPNWDVQLNIPIIDSSFTLAEIIKSENNPNLQIVESSEYDSIYFLFSDQIEKSTSIQDTIKMPVRIVPEDMNITGSGSGSNDMIYNPDPGFILDTALFKTGYLRMKLKNNNFNSSVNYELKAPGFKNKFNGSKLILTGTLNPGEQKEIDVPLKDYGYAQLKKFGINTDSTQRAVGFLIMGKADSPNNEVDFSTEVTNDQITISRMVGKLKRTELAYQTKEFYQTFGKETKDFNSKIKFKSTKVEFKTKTNGYLKNLKIVIDSMTVVGYNVLPGGGLSEPFPLLFKDKPYFSDTLIAGELFEKVFDEVNTNIPDFIMKMPDVIKLGSKYTIDNIDPNSKGSISNEDLIIFDLNISAPAYISAADAGLKDTIEVKFSNDKEEDEKSRDNIFRANNANLTIELENHIPLGLLARITFVDSNYNELFSFRNLSGNISDDLWEVGASQIDEKGIPTIPTSSKNNLVLTKEEFQMLKKAKNVFVDLKIRSTGSTSNEFGNYVRIRAKDYVKLKMYGGVNYNMDPEGM